ncbi:MAG: hypothetical protein PWR12_1518 [Eubacteriaceae bacterium]|jgi:hypothetical protein|nr:hypothetical protein [Eubacteriaceae bacterium]MDK2961943.1 hypothetical protein [Eubacteriaceae bacterium]
MEKNSLKVLWENATRNLSVEQDTPEHKKARENYNDALQNMLNVDYDLANIMDEANNDLAYYETYQAFELGFKEAVGLLMGCAQ